MTQQEVLQTFLLGAGLENDGEDAIAIGTTTPLHAPKEGVFFVMQKHTREVDLLLQQVVPGSVEQIRLQSFRGFTYEEYLSLYDFTIKPVNFSEYQIFQSLFIQTEKERRQWTYLYPDKTYENYMAMLCKSLQVFDTHGLVSFFLALYPNGSFVCSSPAPTHPNNRSVRSREIGSYGTTVF